MTNGRLPKQYKSPKRTTHHTPPPADGLFLCSVTRDCARKQLILLNNVTDPASKFFAVYQKRLEEEINHLMIDIRRIGEDDGTVTFGELFDDDEVQQYYEALVGTLKSAKKRGLIDYKGILLLKGVSDSVVISIKHENSNN